MLLPLMRALIAGALDVMLLPFAPTPLVANSGDLGGFPPSPRPFASMQSTASIVQLPVGPDHDRYDHFH